MQLNLRTAVYQVPEYITSYYQNYTENHTVVGSPHRRPGVETLIFGGTATELERKHGNSSVESEIGEETRHYSHAIELVTTSVHVPQGKKLKLITASADFSTGKQLPPSPQLRRASSFQDPPSLSLQHNVVDMTAIPNALDEGPSLSPTSNGHSESPNRSVPRANLSSARVIRAALGFDSKHNWALAKPTSSSTAALLSSRPNKKQIHNPREEGIPPDDMSEIPPPRDLEPRLHRNSLQNAPDSNLRVEVQVEREHDESGVSLLPQPSNCEDAKRSGTRDGGIMETRIGVWR
jgi:hypothetical protein